MEATKLRIRVASQTIPHYQTEAAQLMNGSTRPLVAFDSQWLAARGPLYAIPRVFRCRATIAASDGLEALPGPSFRIVTTKVSIRLYRH